MDRLAKRVYQHRRVVVGGWCLILAAAVAYMLVIGGALTSRQELPGSESVRAGTQLARDFGIPQSEPVLVVFEATSGSLATHRAVVAGVLARLQGRYPKLRIVSPLAVGAGGAISRDGHVGYAAVTFGDMATAEANAGVIERLVRLPAASGVRVYSSGTPALNAEIQPQFARDLTKAEAFAVPLSLLVLLMVLGSLVAAVVPLALAGFVIPTVLAIVFAVSHATDVTVYATNLVTMIGLGIAVDYSLLVVYRFREELERCTSTEAAVAATMRSAGRSVVFSGVTVGIGLAVLLFVRVPFVESFGMAGILIPSVTILAALTLLPAVLGIVGGRIDRLRVVPRRVLRADESGAWRRLATAIMRVPVVFLVIGAGIAILIAAPVRDLAIGASPLASLPNTGPAASGERLLGRAFGNGATTPLRVLVDTRPQRAASIAAALRATPGVIGVSVVASPVAPNETLINVLGRGAVGSADANHLVAEIRGHVLPGVVPTGTRFLVGGGPALFYDFQEALYGGFVGIALILIAVTMLVLFRAFRSILLPLKAVVMNLLSVAGAYGLLVLVFQRGYGRGILGFHATTQIEVWIPLFLFAFLFGLSMDYEVFLLSRMREEIDGGAANTAAVATGLAKTGKLITSAALIMVIAFGALATSRFIAMQEFGFGLAAAVALDATIIRGLVVPSLMRLFGRWNWWVPRLLAPLAGPGPKPAGQLLHGD